MKKKLILLTIIILLLTHSNSLAESKWAVGTGPDLTASARLKVKVIVPKIIILRIGSSGATVDTISWNATPNSPYNDAAYSGAIAPTATDLPYAVHDPIGQPNGIISMKLWSNAGVVTLTATANDLTDSTTNYTIPVTNIQSADLSGQSLIFNDNTGITFSPDSSGITSYTRNNWPFTFTPPDPMPAAGTYTTTATYTATIP